MFLEIFNIYLNYKFKKIITGHPIEDNISATSSAPQIVNLEIQINEKFLRALLKLFQSQINFLPPPSCGLCNSVQSLFIDLSKGV